MVCLLRLPCQVLAHRVQVNDTIRVVFRNKLTFGANLFLGGGLIPNDSAKSIAAVDPGATTTYTWQVSRL